MSDAEQSKEHDGAGDEAKAHEADEKEAVKVAKEEAKHALQTNIQACYDGVATKEAAESMFAFYAFYPGDDLHRLRAKYALHCAVLSKLQTAPENSALVTKLEQINLWDSLIKHTNEQDDDE